MFFCLYQTKSFLWFFNLKLNKALVVCSFITRRRLLIMPKCRRKWLWFHVEYHIDLFNHLQNWVNKYVENFLCYCLSGVFLSILSLFTGINIRRLVLGMCVCIYIHKLCVLDTFYWTYIFVYFRPFFFLAIFSS